MKKITTETLLEELRHHGIRITTTRKMIVDIFVTIAKPLSVQEILAALHKRKKMVNKTTVYRELEFLENKHMIRQVQLGQDRKRYELTSGKHHHHIRCMKCEKIVDIDFPDHLKKTVRFIEKNTDFLVVDHSLEFIGLCASCRK